MMLIAYTGQHYFAERLADPGDSSCSDHLCAQRW